MPWPSPTRSTATVISRGAQTDIFPLGSESTWVIACIYLALGARGQGLVGDLVEKAVAYAREHGGQIIEAVPLGWRAGGSDAAATVERLATAFLAAGFQKVDKLSEGVSFRRQL